MPRGEFDRSGRRAQTRTRLLEAAASVYARHGFEGATLDQVAAEAGYTKGAVYGHFGSKENLLVALLEEHLIGQLSEQIALFDRDQVTWERPVAGSGRWMDILREDPDRFRLFIEIWVRAQRDERLRRRLAHGLSALRSTFARFASESALDAGFEPSPGVPDQFANVMLSLSLGIAMLQLTDPKDLPRELLGATLSALIRAAESDERTRDAFKTLAADANARHARANP